MVAGMTSGRNEFGKHIFLYGPPGAGKTTAASALAAGLSLPFLDLDAEIARRHGKSIPELFAAGGEAHFRALEKLELRRAVEAHPAAVIALGGGSLLDPSNRRLAEENGRVVLLDVSDDILLTRLKDEDGVRPLLSGQPSERMSALLKERRGHYASFEHSIPVKGLTPAEIAWKIQIEMGRFHLPNPGGRSAGYDVLVRGNALDDLGSEMSGRNLAGPVLIVSDANVAGRYLSRAETSLRTAGLACSSLVLPAGEEQKNLSQLALLWESLLSAGLDRGSTVLALGGGVVSDLAGFAAATYLRGLPWVVVPTTLLAMVDAGLGGKTGIDLPRGKNLAGAFHPPALVLIDPEVLVSLPEVEFRSGLAEAIKAGLIADPTLYSLCVDISRADPRLAEMIRRAVAVKLEVIREDPYEKGRRAVLNLGHTIGHGVELASGYALRHGEAVAIGLAAETRLAEDMGIAEKGLSERIAADLSRAGLPVEIPPDLDSEAILQAIKHDKKRANGVVRFALARCIGEAVYGVEIEEGRIRDAIDFRFTRA